MKISIIIPVYNCQDYLEDCLESVINQTYKNLEIICINDGSQDNSLKILKEYKAKDDRITIITQKNQGISCARNKGINSATGEYITFLDSDDYVSENYYEKMIEAIKSTNSDIAIASIIRKRLFNEKYRVKYDAQKTYSYLIEKIKICDIPNCCYVWNKLYKKELIQNNKFKVGAYYEDVFWLPEIIKKSKKIVTVPNIFYYYVVNKNSIVKKVQSEKKQKDSYIAKRNIVKFFEKNNLELPKKHQKYTKSIKYFGKLQLLKTKEYKNQELKYLFGFIKIPKFLLNLLQSIKILFKSLFSISFIDNHYLIYFLGFQIRKKIKPLPREKTTIKQRGVTSIKRKPRIIASLTTFPERINTVKETIKTLLSQTLQPDEIVLWLATEQFPQGENSLPGDLLALKEYGLLIKWCNDIKSYKKLIPSLKDYKEDIIITFDDDIYYDDNVIENLYKAYLEDKDCIYTNRAHRIKLKGNTIAPLSNAEVYWTNFDDYSFRNTIIGCGGVLYPPNCFCDEVLNEAKFKEIIPSQDDIWFWAMAVLSNRKIKVVSSFDMNIETVENTQQYGLCKINKKSKKGASGKESFKIIAKHYPRLITKLKDEYK